MLDQNVSRLMMLIGGVLVCVGVLFLLKDEFPIIKEAFQSFFSQRITKY